MFLTHGFSWCMYAVITLHSCDDHLQVEQLQQARMNMGTLSYVCHVRNKSLLLKRTITAFLPSPGNVFITSITMLNARPMFRRTLPVQDLIENETTDFAYQNLGWMRYCYSTEAFGIHPTDWQCCLLHPETQSQLQCRLRCNDFLCIRLFLPSLPIWMLHLLRQKAF